MKYLIVVNDLDKERIIKKINTQKELFSGKVIGYREFIKKFYFDYSDKTIVYIVEKYQVSQEIAEIYLKNLYFLNFQETTNEKIAFLMKLYSDLKENHKITESPLWKEKLKKLKIVFYHIARQDKLFQKITLACKKITKIEILDYQSTNHSLVILKEYTTIEQEVEGVCTEIVKKIKEGYSPNQIYVTNLTETHRNLLTTYSKLFHIPIECKKESLIHSSILLQEFLENYSKGIEESLKIIQEKYKKPEELEIIQWIISICNRYAFIPQEERKKYFIIETLKKGKPTKQKMINAVHEIDFQEQEISKNEWLFVLGVVEGKFPKIWKDDEFLNEEEKKILQVDSIEEKNELEKQNCLVKINTISNIQLSYAKKDGNLECYRSYILEQIPLQIEKYQEEINHSHQYNQILLGRKMDRLKKYGTEEENLQTLIATYSQDEYNSYQNQYQQVEEKMEQPITLSYSTLDTFFHCSFRYYLDHVLKISPYEETFDKKIGTLFHQILKESYNENFNFEDSWQKNSQEIIPLNAKERFFCNKLKEDIKRDIKVIKEQDKQREFQVITEHLVTYEIEKNTILKGIIDKIYWKKEQDETLISIIDYKTGTPNTNLDYIAYGINLQLPIYLLLLKKLPFENIKIVGFYLQKILSEIKEKDNIHTEEELKEKSLMLRGYSIDLENRLQKFDPLYENSKTISGMKKTSKGFYAYANILSEEQFVKIEQLTIDLIQKANKQIKNFDFPINPKRIGNKLIGCDYCKFQDICYRKEENIINQKEINLEETIGG